jgi:hypothetical protein
MSLSSSPPIGALQTLSNATTSHIKSVIISARRLALRRLGIRTMSASANVVLTLDDINAALKENGGDHYYTSSLPPNAVVPRGGKGGDIGQVDLKTFVEGNLERGEGGGGTGGEWRVIMEWLAVDGVKTDNTAVGGSGRGRKRKNGDGR